MSELTEDVKRTLETFILLLESAVAKDTRLPITREFIDRVTAEMKEILRDENLAKERVTKICEYFAKESGNWALYVAEESDALRQVQRDFEDIKGLAKRVLREPILKEEDLGD